MDPRGQCPRAARERDVQGLPLQDLSPLRAPRLTPGATALVATQPKRLEYARVGAGGDGPQAREGVHLVDDGDVLAPSRRPTPSSIPRARVHLHVASTASGCSTVCRRRGASEPPVTSRLALA